MKIYKETTLTNFEFWSGAKHNAKMLTYDELDTLTDVLEDIYPDGLSETEINDLMWFDFESVCELIGIQYDIETDEIKRD